MKQIDPYEPIQHLGVVTKLANITQSIALDFFVNADPNEDASGVTEKVG